MKTIYRNNVIAALRKVVGYSVPKHLYHETTIDDLQAIRSEGLVPRVGDIVQTLDSYDEETNLDATFLSDEENELGGYVIWKVANKLGYSDWSKVTWDDIEEHGLLAIVDIDKHDGDEPVYKYLDDGKVINLDGEEVEYIETMEREMYADDCCSSPIEQGNWFSYVGVVPDRYITGKELVNYIKKVSTNNHVKNLMTKTEAALWKVLAETDSFTFKRDYLKKFKQGVDVDGLIPATDQNIKAAKKFAYKKWQERAAEREDEQPKDLSSACKFSSVFAQILFGGEIQGNEDHQFVVLDGKIIDLTEDSELTKSIPNAYEQDNIFFGNRDHIKSMRTCLPRLERWINEFLSSISEERS